MAKVQRPGAGMGPLTSPAQGKACMRVCVPECVCALGDGCLSEVIRMALCPALGDGVEGLGEVGEEGRG